jgi:hypothetical protein
MKSSEENLFRKVSDGGCFVRFQEPTNDREANRDLATCFLCQDKFISCKDSTSQENVGCLKQSNNLLQACLYNFLICQCARVPDQVEDSETLESCDCACSLGVPYKCTYCCVFQGYHICYCLYYRCHEEDISIKFQELRYLQQGMH